MKILLVHNFYQQPGGEDLVYADEGRLLESHGHQVVRYTAHNDQVGALSPLALAGKTIWNRQSHRDVTDTIERERPDLVHSHNTFPLISPALYYAASSAGIPVVQTLHNFRLICPAALCFRDGQVCTECVGRMVPWGAVRHSCYRHSRTASAGVATMVGVHRAAGTWRTKVGVYVALTEMSRTMFVGGGIPAAKIVVKPNFVDPDPGAGEGGEYTLFVGRLSAEKGVQTLLDAWRRMPRHRPLVIVGDGPLAGAVRAAAAEMPAITWLNRRDPSAILALLRDAGCLVFPSECYETFGRVIAEAFATATPVIAAGHGAAAELVRDGVTGLHFRVGDAEHLASTVTAFYGDSALRQRMRTDARKEFERRYTADANYGVLMDIYRRVLVQSSAP